MSGNGKTSIDTATGDLCALVPTGYCSNPPPDPKNRAYQLRDDEIWSLPIAHDFSVLKPILDSVYIRLLPEELPVQIPFERNLEPSEQRATPLRSPSSPAWWNMRSLLAFDGELFFDFDPTMENGRVGPTGATVSWGTSTWGDQPIAATFSESIRDIVATAPNGCRPTILQYHVFRSNIAHEGLHTLLVQHDGDTNGGLMCAGMKNFPNQPHRFEITESQKAWLRGAPRTDSSGVVRQLTKPYVELIQSWELGACTAPPPNCP